MSALKCGEYFSTMTRLLALNKTNVVQYSLNYVDAAAFKVRLSDDAIGLCYSSIVTFASALQDCRRKCGSWSVIKGYYATFYAMRSMLAASGIGVAYVGKTPIEVRARAGTSFRKRKGHTHEVVYTAFVDHFPNDPVVVNNIAGEEPILWLRNNREFVNYRVQRFADPDAASGIKLFDPGVDLRKLLAEYVSYPTYAFDPDHASIALPLACVLSARNHLATEKVMGTVEQKQFVKSLLNDAKGTLSSLYDSFVLTADGK